MVALEDARRIIAVADRMATESGQPTSDEAGDRVAEFVRGLGEHGGIGWTGAGDVTPCFGQNCCEGMSAPHVCSTSRQLPSASR
jgi:hypothetical protein